MVAKSSESTYCFWVENAYHIETFTERYLILLTKIKVQNFKYFSLFAVCLAAPGYEATQY